LTEVQRRDPADYDRLFELVHMGEAAL